jgi:hypothetical protein
MAKGQKRTSREIRKPKQDKKAPAAPGLAGGSLDPVREKFAANRNGARPRP